jgi:general stress protein 26
MEQGVTPMARKNELKDKFWDVLANERTVMLACTGVYPRPMTAMVENGRGPVWFFTAVHNDLTHACARRVQQGLLVMASRDHALFATVGGALRQDNDPAVIDRLWNPFVAAWYSGKDDPELRLLRFEPDAGELWENGSSLVAGAKMLLGIDPKRAYKDKVAKVKLGR